MTLRQRIAAAGLTAATVVGAGTGCAPPAAPRPHPPNLVAHDTGAAGDPECASAALGAELAGGRPARNCPADALSGADAAALEAAVRDLAGRGARSVRIAGDTSPRGVAAAGAVRGVARRLGLAVDPRRPDVVVAVGGWSAAAEVLAGAPVAARGVLLAPWLVRDGIVAAGGAVRLAALAFDPQGDPARAYVAALRAAAPGAPATAAGLAAYAAARGEAVAVDPGLYAVTVPFQVVPMPGMAHAHGADHGWLAGGVLTRVGRGVPADLVQARHLSPR